MSRVTLAALAFLLFAIGLSGWLLMRPREAVDVTSAGAGGAAGSPVGLTFAEWSVRSDGVLLADIEPGGGSGASTLPRRFLFVPVVRSPEGTITLGPGRSFSWAVADRKESADTLFALGFRVSPEGRAYTPPEDALWSGPVQRVDGGTEETLTLRPKPTAAGGAAAADVKPVHFVRRRAEARSAPFWNRRAIGFVSGDGRMVYVTPDAVVIPSSDAR